MKARAENLPPQIWGERVYNRREELRMTQAQLAQEVGVTQISISRIEQGLQAPRIGLMKRLTRALHVETIDELFPHPDPWREQ